MPNPHLSIKIADQECSSSVPLSTTTPSLPSICSGRSSASGEYDAILEALSGPPLTHKPILNKVPITMVVMLVSALVLLLPVMVVWGINMMNMGNLSTERRDEALMRRADSIHNSVYSATSHCERLITDLVTWLDALPKTGDDWHYILNSTWYGWTLASRDPHCGSSTFIYVENGFFFFLLIDEHMAIMGLQDCVISEPTCLKQSVFVFDPSTSQVLFPFPFSPDAEGWDEYITTIEELGKYDQLNQMHPVWGKISPGDGKLRVSLFAALKRSSSGSMPPVEEDPITGMVRFDMLSAQLTDAVQSGSTEGGIHGAYIVEPVEGWLLASTLENFTGDSNGTTVTAAIMANESSVLLVRNTYAKMPQLSQNETVIIDVDGSPVAYKMLVTEWGLEAVIVTIGEAAYFNTFAQNSMIASGITLGVTVVCGFVLILALAAAVRLGLNSIKKAVNWLIEDQLDGSALVLRGDDGEYDHSALERMKHAKYEMPVYFSEMNDVGQSVEKLAANNRELKAFFPSMFVGLSKDEIKSGAHKTDLRCKNVAVMFVDIVKFSPICSQNEANLTVILQQFFGLLESPVFKKKGLTKRLGDGFMAAFGFATCDNDFAELCKRAHDCCRLIIRNLPKLNKHLTARLAQFPKSGMKLRIGISAGQASIGVVQTDAMSNADVYGGIVNLAQRMEDSGRYNSDQDGLAVTPFSTEEIPRCVVTVTPEVFQTLDSKGELAKYGVDMHPVSVIVKGESDKRLAYRSVHYDA